MRKLFITTSLALFSVALIAQKSKTTTKQPTSKPVTTVQPVDAHAGHNHSKMDSVSLALGVLVGKNLAGQFPDLNSHDFILSLEAALKGNPMMNPQEANALVQAYQQKVEAKKQEGLKAQEGMAKANEEAFLKQNGQRPGVTTTPSGLQYEVITMGTGAKPVATSKVKVHYHGTMIDGTVFDSSVDRGEPISFPLNGVIKGWTEGLQYMPVGSKFKFYIPYALAYGPQAMGDVIKPYSTLVFEVELLGIDVD